MKTLKLTMLCVKEMDNHEIRSKSGGNCVYQDAIEMKNAGLCLYRYTGERSKKLEKKLSLCLSYLKDRAKLTKLMMEASID